MFQETVATLMDDHLWRGELIKGALDYGVDHILIGRGDSGTCDGGAGMAQALGAVFSDEAGKPVFVRGGGIYIKCRPLNWQD